jgi:hypothetical protein
MDAYQCCRIEIDVGWMTMDVGWMMIVVGWVVMRNSGGGEGKGGK